MPPLLGVVPPSIHDKSEEISVLKLGSTSGPMLEDLLGGMFDVIPGTESESDLEPESDLESESNVDAEGAELVGSVLSKLEPELESEPEAELELVSDAMMSAMFLLLIMPVC
jgi:hypothetical protein